MTDIKTAVFGICTGFIVAGTVWVILPSGSMERSFRNIVTIFLICLIISPIYKNIEFPKFEIPAVNIDEFESGLSDEVDRSVMEGFSDRLSHLGEEILRSGGVANQKVEVECDISEQSGIFISRTVIYLTDSINSDRAVSLLNEGLGIETDRITVKISDGQ